MSSIGLRARIAHHPSLVSGEPRDRDPGYEPSDPRWGFASAQHEGFTDDRAPTVDEFSGDMDASDDLWKDAFEAVAEIYGVGWGLGRDHIPFAEDGRINLKMM